MVKIIDRLVDKVKLIGELAIGKKKYVPVDLFHRGEGGGIVLKERFNLDFEPAGKVLVDVSHKDYQTYVTIIPESLKPRKSRKR